MYTEQTETTQNTEQKPNTLDELFSKYRETNDYRSIPVSKVGYFAEIHNESISHMFDEAISCLVSKYLKHDIKAFDFIDLDQPNSKFVKVYIKELIKQNRTDLCRPSSLKQRFQLLLLGQVRLAIGIKYSVPDNSSESTQSKSSALNLSDAINLPNSDVINKMGIQETPANDFKERFSQGNLGQSSQQGDQLFQQDDSSRAETPQQDDQQNTSPTLTNTPN